MDAFNDEVGKRYGRLVVVSREPLKNKGRTMFVCRCDCGSETIVNGSHLRSGNTRSCGCLRDEARVKARITHGFCKERLYVIWRSIKERTSNPNRKDFKYYGGRGISMFNPWLNDYPAFRSWALENGYDETAKRGRCTIDRIDNSKGYCPDNCRFVSMRVQANNRRKNHLKEENNNA